MWDVIVVGARCAGAAIALRFARSGRSVLMLGKARPSAETLSSHVLVAPAIGRFKDLGLLKEVCDLGSPPVHTFLVEYDGRSYPCPIQGYSNFILCVRRTALDPLLVEAAEEAGVTVRHQLHVDDLLWEGGMGEQSPTPDIRAVGVNTFPVPAGFCSANPSFIWAFAVNTWERQEHLLPVSHQFWLDTNQDGTDDYVVLNQDASGLGTISDGRQLSWVVNLATGAASAFFFAEDATNTGNTVLLLCGEQIGMNAANLLATQVNMDVIAQDFYHGGPGDIVTGLTVTPLGERFYGETSDVAGNTYDAAGLSVYDFGEFLGNSPELGLMLFTNGDRGAGNRGGSVQESETLLFLAP